MKLYFFIAKFPFTIVTDKIFRQLNRQYSYIYENVPSQQTKKYIPD